MFNSAIISNLTFEEKNEAMSKVHGVVDGFDPMLPIKDEQEDALDDALAAFHGLDEAYKLRFLEEAQKLAK